jgi:hypothetical protein
VTVGPMGQIPGSRCDGRAPPSACSAVEPRTNLTAGMEFVRSFVQLHLPDLRNQTMGQQVHHRHHPDPGSSCVTTVFRDGERVSVGGTRSQDVTESATWRSHRRAPRAPDRNERHHERSDQQRRHA